MAVTTVDTNNKLIQFTRDINREFVRENLFSPYMGTGLTAIIRQRQELKSGGEQINIPIVTRLKGAGVGSGTLVGFEDKIDNYGMRAWLAWSRNAVTTNKSEMQKDSADIFGEAKPLLSDWQNQKLRDELITAFMALPSESQPALDETVNGIQYQLSTAAQKNTWNADNSDRIVYAGQAFNATHATALGTITTSTGKLTAANLSTLKLVAEMSDPKIRPFKTANGYEYYVAFAGSYPFRDLQNDSAMVNANTGARSREGRGMDDNPLFQDGDLEWNGIIVRKVPELSQFVTNIWTSLLTAGASSARVEPVFLCGQQAAVVAYGQMIRPTFRKEDDYGFIAGTGIESAYGVSKMFKKHPNTGTKLVQWGVATGFFATVP